MILPDETAESGVEFSAAAMYNTEREIKIEWVLALNGGYYASRKFREA